MEEKELDFKKADAVFRLSQLFATFAGFCVTGLMISQAMSLNFLNMSLQSTISSELYEDLASVSVSWRDTFNLFVILTVIFGIISLLTWGYGCHIVLRNTRKQ
jgi:hypothetical protein